MTQKKRNKMVQSERLFIRKCKKIKLVLTDVDGVLTDGGMYFSENGEVLKKFNTKDGMGMELLLNKGIKTVFVTKEKSKIVKQRAKKVCVALTYFGIKHKEKIIPEVCKKFDVKPEEILYIGDDVNDLTIMKIVGLSACPKNAINEVQHVVDYICKFNGGDGVFREVAEHLLASKTKK